MPEHLTRKELKTDQFAVTAEHAAEYLGMHRRQAIQVGGLVLLAIVVIVGGYFWMERARAVRAEKFAEAMEVASTPLPGPGVQPGTVTFPTHQAKEAAETKAFTEITRDYSGSREAAAAEYILGGIASTAGHDDEARKHFQAVADSGNKEYASLAQLALAQLDFGQNRSAEGQKLLQNLIDHPTEVVSKEQASMTLARLIGPTHPMEARALLTPLATQPGAVGRAAAAAQTDVPAK